MGSPVAAVAELHRVVFARNGDGAAVGAVVGGMDRAGVLAADPERMDPRPPRREVHPEGALEVVVPGEAGALQAAHQPEDTLADIALLAQGLAMLVGQVGGLLIDLPLPRLDFLEHRADPGGGPVLVDGQADREADRGRDRDRGQAHRDSQRASCAGTTATPAPARRRAGPAPVRSSGTVRDHRRVPGPSGNAAGGPSRGTSGRSSPGPAAPSAAGARAGRVPRAAPGSRSPAASRPGTGAARSASHTGSRRGCRYRPPPRPRPPPRTGRRRAARASPAPAPCSWACPGTARSGSGRRPRHRAASPARSP